MFYIFRTTFERTCSNTTVLELVVFPVPHHHHSSLLGYLVRDHTKCDLAIRLMMHLCLAYALRSSCLMSYTFVQMRKEDLGIRHSQSRECFQGV